MKSVTLLSVLLVAAVASASVQIIVDPPTTVTGRLGQETKASLVRAVADPGDTITSIMVQFTGPLVQQWDMTYDEGTELWGAPIIPTPARQTLQIGAGIRDSVVVPIATAWLDPAGADIFTIGTPSENLIGGQEVGAAIHYWYGKGSYLGDDSGEGITYALGGDVTAFTIGQIVMDTVDFNTVGTHITGGFTFKNLASGVDGTAGIDQWIGLVPEPASISLLAIGAVAAFIRRRRA